MDKDNYIWLGSVESRDIYTALMQKMMGDPKAGPWAEAEKPQEGHPLVQIYGNVAVVNVRGSLINGSAGWMMRYGVTGYDDIRQAMIYALQEATVGSIVLAIDSPGGHAEGPHDLAKTIKRVDKVKPVVTYVGTKMYSAALWIGTAARKSFISETAGAGSLGVVMVHQEYSEQLKKEGVKVTVIRAGREKMLANPYEELSDKAKSNLETHAQDLYDIFINAVAENRNLATDVADKKFGQGREFMGQKAVDAGLVDTVGTFEDAMGHAQKLATSRMDKANAPAKTGVVYRHQASNATNVAELSSNGVQILAGSEHNAASCQGTAMPQPLSDLEIAAISAGVTTVAGDATTLGAPAPGAPAAPAADAAPAASAAPAAPAAAPAAAAPTLEAAVAAATAPLLTSLSASQAEVGRLNTQVTALTAAAEKAKPENDGLLAIARASVVSMGVALNQGTTAEAVAAMAPAAVLAEHGRLTTMFKEKFKAGGVSANAAAESAKDKKPQTPGDTFFSLATKQTTK